MKKGNILDKEILPIKIRGEGEWNIIMTITTFAYGISIEKKVGVKLI